MTPYYERGEMVIWHARAEDVLPSLSGGSVAVILTDPPYGVRWHTTPNRTSVLDRHIANDDGSLDLLAILQTALHTLKRGRHLYVFGKADLSTLTVCKPVELIWDKGNSAPPGGATHPWGASYETIQFAVYEPSKANRDKGAGTYQAKLRRGSVLRVPRINGAAITRHPTEKPVPLLRQLIEASSLLGETVLDPFMGSGSTLVAAMLEGRGGIGIEIEERYCEIAARRLSQAPLFTDEPLQDLLSTDVRGCYVSPRSAAEIAAGLEAPA